MIINRLKCDLCNTVSMTGKVSCWSVLVFVTKEGLVGEANIDFCPDCGPTVEKVMDMLHLGYKKEGHRLTIQEE